MGLALSRTASKVSPVAAGTRSGLCWLFCDRDTVRYRIVVKLSFVRAEGRNCRQLPARARLREEPSPADIVYCKRYSLSELDVSG